MNDDAGRVSRTRRQRLQATRQRAFVGRAEELAWFGKWLGGGLETYRVLFVHGPGGIGKSALLRRFGDLSRDAGMPVVEVDCRDIDSPASLVRRVGSDLPDRAVLLLDSCERSRGLRRWLWKALLPTLPDDAFLVVAGREEPDTEWRTDPDLSSEMRVLPLPALAPSEAAELLRIRGVVPAHRPAVLTHAGGHPLALCLDADTTHSVPPGEDWVPPHDIVADLLDQILGEVPSAAHRKALEVCAHAYRTNVSLLRAVLPAEDPDSLFNWLRTLPFVDSHPVGLRPHDLVRDALDQDLRWRDPDNYEVMHRRMREYLLDRARTSSGRDELTAVAALKYLHRAGLVTRSYFSFSGDAKVYEDAYRTEDLPALLELAEQSDVETEIVAFWLRQQPASFFVHRDSASGQPVAFLTRLRLDSPVEEQCAADPVVAALWEHVETHGPLREGEHVIVARFLVHPEASERRSAVMDLMLHRIVVGFLKQNRLAWTYFVGSNPGFWDQLMMYSAHQPVQAAGTGSKRLYGHDWRVMPLDAWLEFTAAEELYGPTPERDIPNGGVELLPRREYRNAVRDALRAWKRPDLLAASPLLRSRLVVAINSAEPVEALRSLLSDAVDSLLTDPREARLHRIVAVSFFHGAPTQEAAAEQLGMAFSTYRSHLGRALDRVSDWLWAREVGRIDFHP